MGSYVDTPLLCIGNERVELKLDRKTGFVKDIYCKETGFHHRDGENFGIWPFGLRMGNQYSPDLVRVEINDSPRCAKQEMIYSVESKSWGKTLEMYYNDLKTTSGLSSGVELKVSIDLNEGSDYFLIRAKIKNMGKYGITRLFSGWGGLIADSTRDKEHLAVPDWSLGALWDNPSSFFKERETFGYPIFGSLGLLDAGWIDLYGEKGGIGIGYLNRQGLAMLFNIQSAPTIPNDLSPPRSEGMGINWQLFNLIQDKLTENMTVPGGIYPLMPGESFSTDPWILAPHAGDWHRMADIYRQEYEKYFKGDYLTWEDTHPTAKEIDLTAYYNYTVDSERPKYEKIKGLVPSIEKVIEQSGVHPENLLVGVLAMCHSPLKWPDHFPYCSVDEVEEAKESARPTVTKLRSLGIDAVLFFTHLFYNHPDANDYQAEAETDYDHQSIIWNHIGNVEIPKLGRIFGKNDIFLGMKTWMLAE
jgi:hypothetical protein